MDSFSQPKNLTYREPAFVVVDGFKGCILTGIFIQRRLGRPASREYHNDEKVISEYVWLYG
jgi:hypothetical protein